MIFLTQYFKWIYENPDIDKSGGIKIQIFFLPKIEENITLYSYMELILPQNPISATFLHVFTPLQNFELLVPVG